MSEHKPELPPKQAAFVREYLLDLNATQAHIRAGYKSKNPDVDGPALLGKPGVRDAIQKAMDKRAAKVEISAEYVLRNLMEVSERCLQRAPVMVGKGKDRKQATEWVEDPETGEEVLANVWQFDAQGVCRANELIGKNLKMFTDKMEHTGKDGSPLFERIERVVIRGQK
jgi:phage terminase small subunit